MTVEHLDKIFNNFNNKQILIIGDVMLDTYVWGKVNRISPEAPVPVLSVEKREYCLGGAANVAKNIDALGAIPLLATCIGDDEPGKRIMDLINRKRGYESKAIIKTKSHKTTTKMRFISQGQHIVRVDEENPEFISAELQEKLTSKIKLLFQNHKIDAVIFADYDKGVISENLIQEVVSYAQHYSIPIMVDPKFKNFKSYHKINLFKPNLMEFIKGNGINEIDDDYEKLFSLSKQFQRTYSIDNMMITLSEKGIFISDGDKYHILPAVIREISDVSGAGDTVISTATLCIIAGLSLYNTAIVANLAGGIVCEYPMVVPIDKKILMEKCVKNVDTFIFKK